MKLLKQSRNGWQYGLDQREGVLLRMLIEEFPSSTATPSKISKTGTDSKSAERERLLNESLTDHRRELKRLGAKLLATRIESTTDGWRLSLRAHDREVLLQLLNDIRIENWHALGEPENLDSPPSNLSEAQLQHHHLMHLAGYFEWEMLESTAESREAEPGG